MELLVVMAIIGVLLVVSIPAISSIRQAHGVSDGAYQIAAAVELGRNEALARKTYVWLGLQEMQGGDEVSLGMVFSKDGTPSLASDNLQAVGRVVRLGGLGFVSPSIAPHQPADLTQQQNGSSFVVGGTTFSKIIMTFTPMGEILTNPMPSQDEGFAPRFAVGLRTMRGGNPDTHNPIDILFDGSIGSASLHRP